MVQKGHAQILWIKSDPQGHRDTKILFKSAITSSESFVLNLDSISNIYVTSQSSASLHTCMKILCNSSLCLQVRLLQDMSSFNKQSAPIEDKLLKDKIILLEFIISR